MEKNKKIKKKITSLHESLQKFFNSQIETKYLSLLCLNYLEYCSDTALNYAQASEDLLSKILSKMEEISAIKDNLASAGFFKDYGLYQKHGPIVEKMATSLNELMKLAQPLFDKPWAKVNLEKNVRVALDSAIETIAKTLQDIKSREKSKIPSEFAKNIKDVDEELTYIFWFDHLAFESDIDDKEFLKNMRRTMDILGKKFNKMNRDMLLNDIDENRLNAVRATDVSNLFRCCICHPTVLIYDLPDLDEDDESDGEKTISRKKKQQEMKNKGKKPVQKIFDKPNMDDSDDAENENTRPNAKKLGKKEENKKVEENVPKKFDINNHQLEQSIIIKPLLLTVIEVNESNPGIFKIGTQILITKDFYQIDKENRKNLNTKYVAKFGRVSRYSEQYQSDIQFDKKLREISRRQFHIVCDEKKENNEIVEVYKIVCTAPPPKIETSFKICDLPFKLQEDNIIQLSETETLQIDVLNDPSNDDASNLSEEEEEAGGERTILRIQKKNQMIQQAKAKLQKRKEMKDKVGTESFLVLEGACESSEFYGKKLIIKSSDYPNGFEFGKNYKFNDDKANTEAKIYFTQGEGWFIKSHKMNDKKFKVLPTRVSVGLYDKIIKGEQSDAVELKPGMIIHIFGFSFRVDK